MAIDTSNLEAVTTKLLSITFEELSKSVANNTLNKQDIAKIYSGSIGSVLQQSVAYTLGQEKNTADIALVDAQRALTEQRTKTEKAQINDVVDGSSVGGLVKNQKDVLHNQKIGYAIDASNKLCNQKTQSWSVSKSQDPEGVTGNSTNQLDDASIGKAFDESYNLLDKFSTD